MDVQEHKPLPGWACAGIGAGFILLICLGLVVVKVFSS